MLSAALTVAVPSNVPIFLESLLEKAVQSRSPEAIRSVNQTLSGLGTSYLDKLAPDSLARFQSHLTELLTKLDMDDPFANLLCLAVLAKFASRPCGPPDNFAPARKYFVGKRAQKTFDLAILKVINACSRSSILSSTGALETLALSEEIVGALSSDEKKSRVGKNSGMTRNLYAKILRPDIDKSLQAAVGDEIYA